MLIVNRRKKHGVDFREVWGAKESCGLSGIILYRGARKVIGKELRKVRTLITDLTLSEEELRKKLQKSCRNHVNRAPRENIRCEYLIGDSITKEEQQAFVDFFMEFWKSKAQQEESAEKYLEDIDMYTREGCFAITKAYRDNELLAYHTYIVGDDFVRSYQSASCFRYGDKEFRTLVAIANKYLHMQDMLYFKNLGKKVYDWGGAGLREEVKSITEFKESFGGDELWYYDCEEVKGIKAEAVKGLINLIGMLGND